MFCESIAALFLVGFISPALGQATSTVSPTVTATVNVTVTATEDVTVTPTVNVTVTATEDVTVTPTVNVTVTPTVDVTVTPTVDVTLGLSMSLIIDPSISSAVVSSSSSGPTTPTEPITKTCAKLVVVIDKPWNDTYKNSTHENFRSLADQFSSALKNKVYSDAEKYTNVEVSEEHFTKKGDKVLAKANLSLIFKGGDEVFIEDVFKTKVATGELDVGLTVVKDSAEFEPQGVSWKDWKAKDGECEEKCDGAAGPFFIVRECEDARCSCKGHKTTKETEECTTYCPSTGAVSVSSVILVIGIFLSSGFL